MKPGFISALLIGACVIAETAGGQTNGHAGPPAVVVESGTATASARRAPTSDSVNNYDTQALRYESSWGNAKIIRGSKGAIVGRVGWFRDFDVEKLVELSPRAVTDAHIFRTNNFRGSVLTAIGATTVAVGIVVTANGSNNAASPMLIIAGAGVLAWGAQHINKGYEALSRSLWWYNRDVVK